MASDSDSEGEFYDAPDSHCDSSFGTPKRDMNIESPVKELLLKTDSEVIKNKDLDRPSTHISDVIVPTSDSLEISCDTQSTQSDNAESNQDCGATSGGGSERKSPLDKLRIKLMGRQPQHSKIPRKPLLQC
ncbi:predicted protein [Nematostella vectensis]|uniref:Uncharacterized protein n=1 Tax=Nematostella vectensis TaxID=45351 RepID=A7SQE3_NEMVE|nr:predicted protein [Nematostella vectensis]|eukprot:XP_001626161.1 predicted protein [Nematostella vectensis]